MKRIFLVIGLIMAFGLARAQQINFTVHVTQLNTGFDLLGKGDLYIDQSLQIVGAIHWSIVKIDAKAADYYRFKMQSKATEYVLGTYDIANKKLNFSGIKKDDQDLIIALDTYQLGLADGTTINGITKAEGKWDGRILGTYTISAPLPLSAYSAPIPMERASAFKSIPASATIPERIKFLWGLLQHLPALDSTTSLWKNRVRQGVLIGNGKTGYVVAQSWHSQTEGYMENGSLQYGIDWDDDAISAYDDSISISKDSKEGIYKLSRFGKRHAQGFKYSEIVYFQDLAFAGLTKVNLLKPTNDFEVTTSSWGLTETKTSPSVYHYAPTHDITINEETHKTAGLKNETNAPIYIRAYTKKQEYESVERELPMWYYDDSGVVYPGRAMKDVDFNAKYVDNDISGGTIKGGWAGYSKFIGQYVKGPGPAPARAASPVHAPAKAGTVRKN